MASSIFIFMFLFCFLYLLLVFVYLFVPFLLTEASVKDIVALNATLGMLFGFSSPLPFELLFCLAWSSVFWGFWGVQGAVTPRDPGDAMADLVMSPEQVGGGVEGCEGFVGGPVSQCTWNLLKDIHPSLSSEVAQGCWVDHLECWYYLVHCLVS